MRELISFNQTMSREKTKLLLTKDKIILYLVLLISILITLLLNGAIFIMINRNINGLSRPYLILFLTNFLCIISIISGQYALILSNHKKSYIKQIDNSNELIQVLRNQKHDFNNHINVISGYIQLNKAKKALDYAFEVCEKPNEIFNIARIKNPIIASYIYDTYSKSKSLNIEMQLYINSSLEHIKIKDEDFYFVLSNLINDTISKMKTLNDDEKVLTIDIDETEEKYSITIINSSLIINSNEYDKVFSKLHNTNLYNVKRLVEKYNGNIIIKSDIDLGTMFIVSLSKQK